MATSVSSRGNFVITRGIDAIESDATVIALGYQLSPWHYDLIESESTREFGHNTFQVGIIDTENAHPLDRQRISTGTQLRSTVGVKFISKVAADAVNGSTAIGGDYAVAFFGADVLRKAIVDAASGNQGSQGNQKWYYTSSDQFSTADGTHQVVVLLFTVWHHLLPTNY